MRTKLTLGAALLLTLAGGAACAQGGVRVIRPAHNAIVRETVQVRVAPGDLPTGGYVSVTIDDKFRAAQALPANPAAPIYAWDTKDGATTDGPHTLKVDVYSSDSRLAGTDTVPVRVANQIAPPSAGLKLTYHWAAQSRLTYRRTTEMRVPGGGDASAAAGTPAAADQGLQTAQLAFSRTVEPASGGGGAVSDLLTVGAVTDHGQPFRVSPANNIRPLRRTVSARGVPLGNSPPADLAAHIGFPIPEMPVRRVGKGDSWQAPVVVALNWDGTSTATVVAECRLEGFEWQDNYPTAKIRETYSGAARFVSRPAVANVRPSLPSFRTNAVSVDRVLYFAYGSGRLIKSVTDAQVTLTPAQLVALGGAAPGGYAGPSRGEGDPGLSAPQRTTVTLDVSEMTTLGRP